MNRRRLYRALYAVIFLEGYAVLATELLALRQLVPFAGNDTGVVSIVIAAVLLPLAVGYFMGGNYRPVKRRGRWIGYREKLTRNILSASLLLVFGLSYIVLEIFYKLLSTIGIDHRLTVTAAYSLLFLVAPVYLLGQTVPLLSRYFAHGLSSETTGRILFCSTAGSFLGSVFSTLVLMSVVGVHNTVIFTLFLLAVAACILSRRILSFNNLFMVCIVALATLFNNNATFRGIDVVENNMYSMIKIYEKPEGGRILSINRSNSSFYNEKMPHVFPYVAQTDKMIAERGVGRPPMSILIIGAGGFTMGFDDQVNHYTFVDIDSSLKDVSEKYFLKTEIKGHKRFAPVNANAFLREDKEKYDVIVLDAFTNVVNVPSSLLTREFFGQVKGALKPDGMVIANVIMRPDFGDAFSVNYDRTFRSVFPVITRMPLGAGRLDANANVFYVYYNDHAPLGNLYTNDKNTYFLDR